MNVSSNNYGANYEKLQFSYFQNIFKCLNGHFSSAYSLADSWTPRFIGNLAMIDVKGSVKFQERGEERGARERGAQGWVCKHFITIKIHNRYVDYTLMWQSSGRLVSFHCLLLLKLHVSVIVKTVVALSTFHSDPLKCQSANQVTASFLWF